MNNVVIVGNGITGLEAGLAIREIQPEAKITLLSSESDYPYSRTALMYISMKRMRVKDTEIFDPSFYRSKGLALVRGHVIRVDTGKKEVLIEGGKALHYDRLLLATGSESVPGFWPGSDLKGVLGYYSLQDLALLDESIPNVKKAVVVGGGLIGIEVVEVLLHYGISTTFLIREDFYWPMGVCREESEIILESLKAHGVEVRLVEEVREIRGDGARVRDVLTNKDAVLPADMVAITIGVRPNIALAEASGIETNRGILVDRMLRTRAEDVWAAGDCAEIVGPEGGRGTVEQLWYTARAQGARAGRNMAGREKVYERGIVYNAAKFLDIEWITAGDVQPASGRSHYFYRVPGRRMTCRLAFEGHAVVGFNILGSRWDTSILRRFVEEGRDLGYLKEHMARAAFDPEFTESRLREALDGMKEIKVS